MKDGCWIQVQDGLREPVPCGPAEEEPRISGACPDTQPTPDGGDVRQKAVGDLFGIPAVEPGEAQEGEPILVGEVRPGPGRQGTEAATE